MPSFGINQRSGRDQFQYVYEKRKSKNREEERVSGISPEITEIYKLLDKMIEIFESVSLKHKSAAKEEAD